MPQHNYTKCYYVMNKPTKDEFSITSVSEPSSRRLQVHIFKDDSM